jgi:hypothetical protein
MIVWIFYLLAASFSVVAVQKVDVRRITFIDGILFGCIYYIVIPMLFILIHGEIIADMAAAPYRPLQDIGTTSVLLSGMFIVPVVSMLVPRPELKFDRTSRLFPYMLLGVFFFASAYSFVFSGVLSGGHWADGAGEVMRQDGIFLLVRHALNFSRCAIFGIFLHWHLEGKFSRRKLLIFAIGVVVIDMLTTFNRITAAYLIILTIVMFRNHKRTMLCSMPVALYVLATASNIWPMFRGLVGVYGYSYSGLFSAAVVAIEEVASNQDTITKLNGIFESSNIVVLNYIVENFGNSMKLLYGEMFVRPFTFFLPRIIWADRPENFGTIVGFLVENREGLALNSTMFGESYANFGHFWFEVHPELLVILVRLPHLLCGDLTWFIA